jgi:hypothetical protein
MGFSGLRELFIIFVIRLVLLRLKVALVVLSLSLRASGFLAAGTTCVCFLLFVRLRLFSGLTSTGPAPPPPRCWTLVVFIVLLLMLHIAVLRFGDDSNLVAFCCTFAAVLPRWNTFLKISLMIAFHNLWLRSLDLHRSLLYRLEYFRFLINFDLFRPKIQTFRGARPTPASPRFHLRTVCTSFHKLHMSTGVRQGDDIF